MCLNQARGPGIAPPGSPPPRVNTHQNTIANRSDGALAPTPQQTSTIDPNFNSFLENNLVGSSETMYFIGLDVHKKTISYGVKDAAGRAHQESKIE